MNAPAADPRDLASQLAPATRWLVALDFDGVLAPIVDHPDDARPPDETVAAIERLAERTPVALVSGRSLDDLRARMPDVPVTWAGGHGAQLRYPDGSEGHLVELDGLAPLLDEVEASVRELVDDEPGWLVERKQASLAVHHRLADPDTVHELLPRVTANLEARRSDGPGFELIHGKAVLELRVAGADKGGALSRIVQDHAGLVPLVLGDDVTDEDAFRAAARLGGTSILVAEEPRETSAAHRLRDPAAVTTFLDALADGDG